MSQSLKKNKREKRKIQLFVDKELIDKVKEKLPVHGSITIAVNVGLRMFLKTKNNLFSV